MKSKIVYKGKVFTIEQFKIVDKDGVVHTVEKCSRPDVVTVIGITKKKEIIMIKEFRSGAKGHVLWFPGGKVEKSEKPIETAKREFNEETAFSAKNFKLFHKKSLSDSFLNEGFVYLATEIIPKKNNKIGDEKGKLQTIIVPIQEAVSLALNGDIPNEFFCFLIIKLAKEMKIIKL